MKLFILAASFCLVQASPTVVDKGLEHHVDYDMEEDHPRCLSQAIIYERHENPTYLETLWRLGYAMGDDDLKNLTLTTKSPNIILELGFFKDWLRKRDYRLDWRSTWEAYLDELGVYMPCNRMNMREAALLVRYSPKRRWPELKQEMDIFFNDGKKFGVNRCFWNAMPGYRHPFMYFGDDDYLFFDGYFPRHYHFRYAINYLPDVNATMAENMWKSGAYLRKGPIAELYDKAFLKETIKEIDDFRNWIVAEQEKHNITDNLLIHWKSHYISYLKSKMAYFPLSMREMSVLIRSRPGKYKQMEHEMQSRMGPGWFDKWFWPKEYKEEFHEGEDKDLDHCPAE